jgi:MATE family multidrug resistance protein
MDTAFVGRIGALELASLGACTSIFHLAFNAFRATTQATTSLVASSLQNNPQEAKEVTQLSLTLGVIMGFCVLIGLRACGTWCLGCMGIPSTSNLFPPAHSYLNARLWAAPAVLFIVVSEGAFRGYGNTKIPLLASAAAAIINLILDPVMIFPMGMGVMGAAAATALSQLGAAVVYGIFLRRNKMLPQPKHHVKVNRRKVIQTILGANVAMMAKQGSLLLAWAYATSRATRLGAAHVAAHQVALSFWLVFALWLDGAAVSAQVLMSRAHAIQDLPQMRSLSKYMVKFATLQGLASTVLIGVLGTFVPHVFTSDPTIRFYLHHLMPHLAAQQVLISLTLVVESLAVGANQFNLLAVGTTLSTLLAVHRLKQATDVFSIWSNGIVTLFAGRLVTALIGAARANKIWKKSNEEKSTS